MSTKERPSLGFGGELEDLDFTVWEKTKASVSTEKPKPAETKKAAEAAGFRSREPSASATAEPAPKQRRRRTGRNVQFNIKTKPETIEAFCAIADANGWGLGETFEFATKLLTEKQETGR